MPLVFSHELDPNTLDATDFAVTTQNGSIFEVEAASFLPANEEFELRTVLLIGEYGTYPDITIGGPDVVLANRLIPTISADQYTATLSRWFGVVDSDLDQVAPYIGNFTERDLGFMA